MAAVHADNTPSASGSVTVSVYAGAETADNHHAPFLCSICDRKFFTSAELVEHERGTANNHGDGIHKCCVCGKQFALFLSYRRHCQEHVSGKRLVCLECGKSFHRQYDLTSHARSHTGRKPYTCDTCGKAFTTSSNLSVHRRAHHGDGMAKTHCAVCLKEYTGRYYITKHKCKNEKTKTRKKPRRVATAQVKTEGKLCAVCGQTFSSQTKLTYHHRQKHSSDKPHTCDVCQEGFASAALLRKHQAGRHSESKPFSCRFCDRAFSVSSHCRYHERTHTGARPYACELCPRAFASHSNLRGHQRLHTGLKPFRCDTCGKAFTRKYDKQRHEAIHREDSAA